MAATEKQAGRLQLIKNIVANDDFEQSPKGEAGTEKGNESGRGKSGGGSGCGCLVAIVLVVAISYFGFDKSDFYLMPGEANLWADAMEQVFDELDRVVPDSLRVSGSPEVVNYMNEQESLQNFIYILWPTLTLESKSSPERKYKMRLYARVHHMDAGEFRIAEMFVDTLYRDTARLPTAE